MSALVKYDEMCRAIDAAYDVDEVANIRDKAQAIELYMRQQRNPEPERRACEIRLRAERKVGKLLKAVDRAQGQRTDKETSSQRSRKSFKEHLDEHGISDDQASRWQQLADVPEEDFEQALADTQTKPSTNSILKQGKSEPKMDPRALWLWGRLRDFERDGFFDEELDMLLSQMTEAMQSDVQRIAPRVAEWLGGVN